MKKKMIWIVMGAMACGLSALAEVVITSPTGTPDESDVVLEAAVDIVREAPADIANVIGDTLGYVGDELINTAHGAAAAFSRAPAREGIRDEMLGDVSEAWNTTDEIQMRTYTLSTAVGTELTGREQTGAITVDVRDFFTGIDFPKGTTAFYRPKSHRLVVFNRPANLLAIEQILGRYHNAEAEYKQVDINAKFIEVSQSTLNELGFSWRIEDYGAGDAFPISSHLSLPDRQDVFSAGLRTAAAAFGGGVPAAGSMVLAKGGWMPLRVAITALEQASDSDVLSSPSLTTRDGAEAEIWVGEDRMVPASFDVNSSEVNIHIQHADWDSQLMGVQFSVTPEILKGNVIRLELKPKIIDLLGYDTYQVSPQGSMMLGHRTMNGRFPVMKYATDGVTDAWNGMFDTLADLYGPQDADPNDMHQKGVTLGENDWNVSYPSLGYFQSIVKAEHAQLGTPLPAVYGQLPYFRVREIETTVDVADGSTVGLGGLIYDRLETYKDKVPVLGSIPIIGRLFRSEGERSIKRNLMIFVSATQVADNGQRKSELSNNE